MATEDIPNVNDPKPEEPKAEPAAPVAPSTPPADALKQAGTAINDSVNQMLKPGAGIDQNKFILVLVLSICGFGWLGSILNGQVIKGIVELVVKVLCIFTICIGIGLILIPVVVYGIAIDTIIIANRINHGETFGDWDFFWKPAPIK